MAGVDAGPLPEPAPIGLVANDRPSISRAPEPPGSSVSACLATALPGARTLVEHPGEPTAVFGTVDGRYAGVCVQGPSGPVFRGTDIPACAGPRAVVAPDPEYLGVAAVLLAVPDAVTRVTIAPASARGPAAGCALGGGLALCTMATTDPVTVTAYAGSAAIPVR